MDDLKNPKLRKRWLRSQRKLLGWNYEEMARRLRCTVEQYKQFEMGETKRCGGIGFIELRYYLEDHVRVIKHG